MCDKEFSELVLRLDAVVPKHDAWVEMWQYGGGPDEGQITANLNGYKRFGIEFLKGCVSPNANCISVDLSYLVVPSSSINLDHFELASYPSREQEAHRLRDRIIGLGCFIGFILLAFATCIGVGTIASWFIP